MNEITKVIFEEGKNKAEASEPIWQWSYGQLLHIEGLTLPHEVEIQFSLQKIGGIAERQIGITKDGITEVSIPNKMLENRTCQSDEYTIYAWIYLSDERSGQTEYEITIPCKVRSRPGDYAPKNEPNFAGKVIDELNKLGSEKLTKPQTAKVGQIFRVQEVNEDGTITVEAVDASECAVTDVQIDGTSIVDEDGVAEIPTDFAKYKYFNFVEIGVDVEGNPTYAEIKEAVENGYIPFLKYGKDGVAHMTVSNCGQNDDQNQGQFTFVASNSRADMGWVMEVNEFWCCLQDDGSTLWGSGTHYSEAFVAEYNVTPTEDVIDAYEKGLEIIVKRSATPEQPAHYARLVRADGYGVTPNLTFTCEENQLSHHYHINGDGWHYWCYDLEQKLFIAEYGVTLYGEILNAFKSNKQLILHIPQGRTSAKQPDMYAPLVRIDNGGVDVHNFVFVCEENSAEHHFVMSHDNKSWTAYDTVLATNDYVKNIDKNLIETISNVTRNAGNISKLLPLLTSAFNSFRGGFVNNAGTMHITDPGIYLILQGGTGNKQIIINQPEGKVLDETWNGIIIMAYNSGVITPIGIKTSLSIAGTIQTPGTFQGWTSDGRYSTTITYPAKCVVAYLGNSNVDYLA